MFNIYTLTPMALEASIAKLQANILHLCFPMNVSHSVLQPRHILHNLAMCFKQPPSSFALNCSYVVYSDLLPEIPADWEKLDMECESEPSGVVRSSMFEDSGGKGEDTELVEGEWEKLALLPYEVTFQEAGSPNSAAHDSQVGGVFASTLAQVSNIWRAATGQK
jgi:hypothetical protein